MAVLYDDPAVTYDWGPLTYDGANAVGQMTGAITIKSAMSGTIT